MSPKFDEVITRARSKSAVKQKIRDPWCDPITRARSVAETLHGSLGTDWAGRLESPIERGRPVLWVGRRTSESFVVVCGNCCRRASRGLVL
jgi:hypothetical protein